MECEKHNKVMGDGQDFVLSTIVTCQEPVVLGQQIKPEAAMWIQLEYRVEQWF